MSSEKRHPTSGRPIIFSASRRTDLIGWYPERCARRLTAKIDRLRTRHVYGLVLWTRFPGRLLEQPLREVVAERFPNTVCNLTVTGLGGTELEPKAPPWREVVGSLARVIDLLGGEPRRIRWRFDPLLYRWTSPDIFVRLADRMCALGVDTCTISLPSSRSLRGSLAAQYRQFGLEPWPPNALRDLVGRMAEIARCRNLRLLSCCRPRLLALDPWIEPAQCVPLEVLEDLHPDGESYPAAKDRSQRRQCCCPRSEDIGDYAADRCRTGCVYCYSPAGGPWPTEWPARSDPSPPKEKRGDERPGSQTELF
jgi:hypothetical protein